MPYVSYLSPLKQLPVLPKPFLTLIKPKQLFKLRCKKVSLPFNIKHFFLAMKKLSIALIISLFTLPHLAFTPNEGLSVSYGVSSSNPAQILLELHDDLSFTYQDLSVAERPVRVEGVYTLRGKRIVLEAHDTQIRFHDHWRMTDEGNAIKSRLGMNFYTLRKK